MPTLSLQYRELLDPGTELELDALISTLNTMFGAEHDVDTGAHADVVVDSLTSGASDLILPVTASLDILKGRLLLDTPGNNVHVAGLRPTQWLADQHNYNPPGGRTAFLIECDTDADRNLTGLERYARQKQFAVFGNRGNFNITVKHNNASSTDHNRFGLPGGADIVLAPADYRWFYYDVGSEIWRLIGKA